MIIHLTHIFTLTSFFCISNGFYKYFTVYSIFNSFKKAQKCSLVKLIAFFMCIKICLISCYTVCFFTAKALYYIIKINTCYFTLQTTNCLFILRRDAYWFILRKLFNFMRFL